MTVASPTATRATRARHRRFRPSDQARSKVRGGLRQPRPGPEQQAGLHPRHRRSRQRRPARRQVRRRLQRPGPRQRRDGKTDRAIADFTQAIRLNPNYDVAYNNRGLIYRGKGDSERHRGLHQAVKANPRYEIAYNNRGMTYKAKGDVERAIADFSQAIAANPNYEVAYNKRGQAYRGKGQIDEAIKDFDAAIKINPNAESFYYRGSLFAEKQDHDRAYCGFRPVAQAQSGAGSGLQRSRQRARRKGANRPGAGRLRAGDPAQSQLRRRLQQSWLGVPAEGRQTSAPSPTSTARSRSIRTSRRHSTAARSRCTSAATTTAPSPISAR